MHGAKRGRACDLCFSDWDAETLNSYIGTKASNVLVRTQLPDVLATENGSAALPGLPDAFSTKSQGAFFVFTFVWSLHVIWSFRARYMRHLPRARSVL